MVVTPSELIHSAIDTADTNVAVLAPLSRDYDREFKGTSRNSLRRQYGNAYAYRGMYACGDLGLLTSGLKFASGARMPTNPTVINA